jgi:carboxyl-terminal processing protease
MFAGCGVQFNAVFPVPLGKIVLKVGAAVGWVLVNLAFNKEKRMKRSVLERGRHGIGTLGMLLLLVSAGHAQGDTQAQKFSTLLNYINRLYVEPTDTEALVEAAIVAMLEEMDPHSVYIPAEELKEADEPLNGNFEGVGIQFNIFKDTIMVVNPIPGGPSEKLGIMAGDRIIRVDGEVVAGIGVTNNDVQKLLKGPKGTVVRVSIQRGKDTELLEYEIVRDQIPIYSIDAAYMVNNRTGYIKINRFAKTTMEELHAALDTLKSQGMKDLILDLQGNGGGMLRTAEEMLDEFLSGEKLMVYTEGRSFPKEEKHASVRGRFEKGRLVVLIDEGSASASEIVSGGIQDWDRGLIVGRRSFGKGLVQRPVYLPDGSAVRLTVQKYYTPSGRCIQKPYEDGVDAYRMERFDRYSQGELFSIDSLETPDSLRFFTRIQNRPVYGGGGILPDVFVPVDTTDNSEYFSRILRKGLDNRWALSYVDSLRATLLERYPTPAAFLSGFQLTQVELDRFIAFVDSEEVPFVAEDWAQSKDAISLRLKAMIGRNIHTPEVFYQAIAPLNEALQRAIEVLQDGTFERMNLAHKTF